MQHDAPGNDACAQDELEPLPLPADPRDINERRTAADLRSLVLVMKRAARQGRLEESLASMAEFSRANPTATVLLPSPLLETMIPQFLLFGLCSGKTSTATVTLAGGVVFGAARTVGFGYTFTGTPVCDVKLTSVTLAVGMRTLAVTTVNDTGAVFTGVVPGLAGALPVGAAATITATFSASANGWCNSCLLPTPTVTANVTIA